MASRTGKAGKVDKAGKFGKADGRRDNRGSQKRRRLWPEERQQVLAEAKRMRDSGDTYDNIAEVVGLNRDSIRRMLKGADEGPSAMGRKGKRTKHLSSTYGDIIEKVDQATWSSFQKLRKAKLIVTQARICKEARKAARAIAGTDHLAKGEHKLRFSRTWARGL